MPNLLKLKRGTAATIPQGQLAEPLFTTDTYDLYIGKGAGGNQRIQNYIASGTSSQFLKGDGSLDSTSYQTALTFSSPLVNTSGTISIPAATGSVNGYLTSTDWTTFNSKEPAITAGTSLQYYRGDKTFQTLNTSVVPESGAIYFTEPRVLDTVLTGLNLSGGGTIAATDSVLTAFGKVQNQISALVGGATYQGVWNASTNSPSLASGVGTKGFYYVVSVAGSTNLDGITDWKVGDWAIFNGTTWDKVDNTDAVSSVNGFTGAVNLGLGDISNVTLTSPTNAQLLRFNGTSSKWENWTPTYISGNQTITLSGDVSGSGSTAITTTIGALKVTNAMLAGTIDYAKMDATTVPTWNQNTTGSAATLTTARTLTIGATGKTFNGSADVSWTLAEIGAQAALTNPVTGTGSAGRIAYWSSTSAITSSSTFTYSPTDVFNVNNTISAGGIAMNFTGTINAAANNDILYGLKVTPTFNNGAFTGVTQRALGVFGNVYINGTITGAGWGGAVIGSSYGGAGTVSGIMKANGSGTVSAAVAGTDYVAPSALSGYLPLSGGTLTGALSGTSATFSGNVAAGTTLSSWGAGDFYAVQVGKGASIFGRGTGDEDRGGFSTNAYHDGTSWKYIVSSQNATQYYQTDGAHYFYTAGTGTAGAAITWSNPLTIASTGAATFSDLLSLSKTSAGIVQEIGGNITKANIYQFSSGGLAGAVFNIGHNFYFDGTNYGQGNSAKSGWVISSNLNSDTFSINRAAAGSTSAPTSVLSFASTGAATFSSSVTAATALITNPNSGDYLTITNTDPSISGGEAIGLILDYTQAASSTGWKILSRYAGGNLQFLPNYQNAGYNTPALSLNYNGAATFAAPSGAGTNNAITSNYAGDSNYRLDLQQIVSAGLVKYAFSVTNAGTSYANNLVLDRGSVGIGTASPSGQLHIKGASGLTNFGDQMLQVESSTSNYSGIVFSGTSGSNAAIRSEGASTMTFWTASGTTYTERMRITSGGNVGIGTTSPIAQLGITATGYTASLSLSGNTKIFNKVINGLADGQGGTPQYYHFATYTIGAGYYTEVVKGTITCGRSYQANNLSVDIQFTISVANGVLNAVYLQTEWKYFSGNFYVIDAGSGVYKFVVYNDFANQTGLTYDLEYYAEGGTGAVGSMFTPIAVVTTTTIPSGTQVTQYKNSYIKSNGNVGIGTTSPQATLHIVSPVVTAGTALKVVSDGNSNDKVFEFTGADGVAAQTMVMTQGGNVGIGTTSPSYQLQVLKNQAATTTISIDNNTGNTAAHSSLLLHTGGATSGDPFVYFNNEVTAWSIGCDNSDSDKFKISQASTLGTNDFLTITSGGNVGIGTTSPSYLLHAKGASPRFWLEDSTASGSIFEVSADTTAASVFNRSNLPLTFGTNNTERMRITSSGNMAIGNTVGNTELHIHSSDTDTRIQITNSSTGTGSNTGLALAQQSDNSYIYNYQNGPMIFGTYGTERMRISATGELWIAGTTDQGAYNLQCNGTGVWGAGAYVNGSDIALKDNINDIGSTIEIIKKLKPKTFNYKNWYSKDQDIQTGFIAQELEEALYDQLYLKGIVKSGKQYKNVAYQNIIPLLVKAIQEQQIEIDNLKSK